MAIKRPLITEDGILKELPEGDSIEGSLLNKYAVPVIAKNPDSELVFDQNGDIVLIVVGEGDL